TPSKPMWLPARTAAPQPPKTSTKVPISSAAYRFIHPPGFFTNGDSRKRYNLNTTSEPHGQVRVSTLEQLSVRRTKIFPQFRLAARSYKRHIALHRWEFRSSIRSIV